MNDSLPLLTAVGLAAILPASALGADGRATSEYPDFYDGDSTRGIDFVQRIEVLSPAVGASVSGDVAVSFRAPGMTRAVARCWGLPEGCDPRWGGDVLLADLALDADGAGAFVFRADAFPHGPATLRIQAKDDRNLQDYFELQLFNEGGVRWRAGLPKDPPPGAAGMRLVFADDFDRPPSISRDGIGARYAAHKTGGGDFSGWPFSDPAGPDAPFGQRDTWLRIHASKPAGTAGRTGILASLRADGTGVCVPVPSYFECRFVAHSAPGAWPSFWTLTRGTRGMDRTHPDYERLAAAGADELDAVECYGGYGPHNPNHGGHYGVTSHFWGQDDTRPDWSREKLPDGSPNPAFLPMHLWLDAMEVGGGSAWSWTAHDYGLAITETDTVYYLDGVEVLRHPTGPVSLDQPAWFLIDYAIGGISGWPIDMERYGNRSDMWVDWVRVYCGRALEPRIEVDGAASPGRPARVTCTSAVRGAEIRYTLDGSEPTTGSERYRGPVSVTAPCRFRAAAFAPGLLPSRAATAAIEAPRGPSGCIGVNFVADAADAGQRLGPGQIAGIGDDAQGFWNNVPARAGRTDALLDHAGAPTPVSLEVAGDVRPLRGESWGFTGHDEALKRGNVGPAPVLRFRGIPFARYDVLVHLGAGPDNVQGVARLRRDGAETDALAFNYSWNGGKHAFADAAPGEVTGSGAPCSNAVLFRDVSGADVEIAVEHVAGKGWPGVAGVQILPRSRTPSP